MNMKIERFSKSAHFVMVKLTVLAFTVPSLLITMANHFIYDLGDESFFLPYRAKWVLNVARVYFFYRNHLEVAYKLLVGIRHLLRLPYDWRTPFGYLIILVVQGISTLFTVTTVTPIIGSIVVSCWLFASFIEDITNDLSALSVNGSTRTSTHKITDSAALKEQFCNIIQNHSDIKELSIELSAREKLQLIHDYDEYFFFHIHIL